MVRTILKKSYLLNYLKINWKTNISIFLQKMVRKVILKIISKYIE